MQVLRDVAVILAPMLALLILIVVFPELVLAIPRWLTPQFLNAGN